MMNDDLIVCANRILFYYIFVHDAESVAPSSLFLLVTALLLFF